MADDGITEHQGERIITLLEKILSTLKGLDKTTTETGRDIYKARCRADEISQRI
jgi:hypothetical protein